MPDSKPVPEPDCPWRMQGGADPMPFGQWLESQRKQIAEAHSEAAARLAGVQDQAGFRELLLGPDGNAILAILIGAKAPAIGELAPG